MNPIGTLRSHAALLAQDDVDTDQIIPARFLKVTTKDGLGDALFADWRYAPDGTRRPEFPLHHASAAGAKILVAGRNFGCGSSREHAPWALKGFGFDAVIARSFADIFRNNALKNGLIPVALDDDAYGRLIASLAADPAAAIAIDLARSVCALPDGSEATFPIDAFSRDCLLAGVDELGYLLSFDSDIARFEEAR